MIAFKDNLPALRFDDDRVMELEQRWLSEGIARAAARAGYQKWWLTSHVTETVMTYFRNDFEAPTLGLAQLKTAVQSVLQVIGYADVASHFEPMPPPVRVSLAQLARKADTGYELAFFQLLREELRQIVQSSSLRVEFFDLNRCVKMLRSAKNWRADCNGLRAEIVRYVRSELDASNRPLELQLQLS